MTSHKASKTVRAKAKIRAAIAATCLFVGALALSTEAKADLIDCLISAVWYDDYTGGRLALFCNNDLTFLHGFFTNLAEPACMGSNSPTNNNRSLDTIKVWASMSTAFQLASHHVIIDFNPAQDGSAGHLCTIKTINNIRSN